MGNSADTATMEIPRFDVGGAEDAPDIAAFSELLPLPRNETAQPLIRPSEIDREPVDPLWEATTGLWLDYAATCLDLGFTASTACRWGEESLRPGELRPRTTPGVVSAETATAAQAPAVQDKLVQAADPPRNSQAELASTTVSQPEVRTKRLRSKVAQWLTGRAARRSARQEDTKQEYKLGIDIVPLQADVAVAELLEQPSSPGLYGSLLGSADPVRLAALQKEGQKDRRLSEPLSTRKRLSYGALALSATAIITGAVAEIVASSRGYSWGPLRDLGRLHMDNVYSHFGTGTPLQEAAMDTQLRLAAHSIAPHL